MRPVVLSSLNYPGIGGIENSLTNLSAALAKQGVDTAILSFPGEGIVGKGVKQIVVPRSPLYRVLRLLLTGSVAAAIVFYFFLKQTFSWREVGETVVISRHPVTAYAFHAAGFRRHVYVPPASMTQFYDGVLSEVSALSSPLVFLKTLLIGQVDVCIERRLIRAKEVKFVTFSQHLAAHFCREGKETQVVEPGVDGELLRAIDGAAASVAREAGEAPRILRLIYVGRIERGKNLPLLLSAVRKASSLVPVVCEIVGTGAILGDLRRTFGADECIQFVGPKTKQELASVIARADFLVLPTYKEGFGQVLPEALACGTGVIGYSSEVADTAISQVVSDARFGIVIPELGEKAMISALLDAHARLPQFRASRVEIAKAARDRFDWTAFAVRVLELVE